jgi:hypothetical protein
MSSKSPLSHGKENRHDPSQVSGINPTPMPEPTPKYSNAIVEASITSAPSIPPLGHGENPDAKFRTWLANVHSPYDRTNPVEYLILRAVRCQREIIYKGAGDGVYMDLKSHHILLLPSHSVEYNELLADASNSLGVQRLRKKCLPRLEEKVISEDW